VDHLLASRDMFEQDWKRHLGYLTPDAETVTFTAAWQVVSEAVRLAQISL
jgi:hypothetical protein